jgi:hypothetical protein
MEPPLENRIGIDAHRISEYGQARFDVSALRKSLREDPFMVKAYAPEIGVRIYTHNTEGQRIGADSVPRHGGRQGGSL